jgi:glycerophosphoryl diester phosphodiesterase
LAFNRLLRLGVFAVAPVIAYQIAQALARPAPPHPLFERFTRRPLVIAHRGGQGLWPSNTLYAFQRAVDLGADMIELDVHASREGTLVVMHDATVDRTTDGSGPIREKSLAEIKALEAGYHWSGTNNTADARVDSVGPFPYRGMGIRVPTLAEVFEALPDFPFTIEIKQAEPSIVQPLGELIRRHGKQHQVIIGSFHSAALNEFRTRFPEIATSGHVGDIRTLVYLQKLRLLRLLSPGYQAIQVPMRHGRIPIITPRSVRAAQERGLETHVWTVNDRTEMRKLVTMGIDGIITDYPDRLIEELGRKS